MAMRFRPVTFDPDQPMPIRHTGDGADVSPRLRWDAVPADTRSLVVLCEDVDAPVENFPHWVLYNLPPQVRELPENLPPDGRGIAGINGFSTTGWRGPLPPPGEEHRYVFSLIALDAVLPLAPGATRDALEAAMSGHVLQEESFVVTYRRLPHTPTAGPSRSLAGRPSARRRSQRSARVRAVRPRP